MKCWERIYCTVILVTLHTDNWFSLWAKVFLDENTHLCLSRNLMNKRLMLLSPLKTLTLWDWLTVTIEMSAHVRISEINTSVLFKTLSAIFKTFNEYHMCKICSLIIIHFKLCRTVPFCKSGKNISLYIGICVYYSQYSVVSYCKMLSWVMPKDSVVRAW